MPWPFWKTAASFAERLPSPARPLAKALYRDILELVEDRLGPGALIVADNADVSPDYLARVRTPAAGYLSTPFADDIELSTRV